MLSLFFFFHLQTALMEIRSYLIDNHDIMVYYTFILPEK